MSSCSSTTLRPSSCTSLSFTGSASGASSVLMITNSWVLGPSFEMLNVTEPAGALAALRPIEKSFSVAEMSPASEPPAEELLDEELLQPTPPASAIAAAAIVMRANNRSMDPLPLYGCRHTLRGDASGGQPTTRRYR